MACSCNKGIRNAGRRPIVTPKQRSITNGVGRPPIQRKNLRPTENPERQVKLLSERKIIENKRRKVIAQRVLGK